MMRAKINKRNRSKIRKRKKGKSLVKSKKDINLLQFVAEL